MDLNYTIAKAFSKIGKENNITLHACCEKEYLKDYGRYNRLYESRNSRKSNSK